MSHVEDYDAVPVVDVVGLYIGAFGLNCEAVGVHTVFVNEGVVHCLSAALGETHVVSACTGILVSIAYDSHVLVGIFLHPLGDVVYVDHFGIGDLRGVEREANGCHKRSSFHYSGLGFNDFGARELCFCSGEGGSGSGKGAAKVVDLTIEVIDISEVIARIICLIVAATECDGETGICCYVDVDGTAISDIVEIVTVERSACFSEEVDIFA